MSDEVELDVSVIDREDIKARAWKRHGEWIAIYIRNDVDVPVPILKPGETLVVVIVPKTRAPLTPAEESERVHKKLRAYRSRYCE